MATDTLVEVNQADRDEAARWCGYGPNTNDRIRAGECDHLPGVQAFANHRLASQASTDRPTSELERALLDIANEIAVDEAFKSKSEYIKPQYHLRKAATRITTLEATIARLQAEMREAVEAIDGLPVEEMVQADRNGDPELVGYCMQAQGEWDRVREAAATLTTLLSDAPEDRGEGEQS